MGNTFLGESGEWWRSIKSKWKVIEAEIITENNLVALINQEIDWKELPYIFVRNIGDSSSMKSLGVEIVFRLIFYKLRVDLDTVYVLKKYPFSSPG